LNSLAEKILWPPAPANLRLRENEVHVWAAPLDVVADVLTNLADTLFPEEKERAAKFKFEKHRNRFSAGRGWLREILGRYLQIGPAELRFTYSANGKPTLSQEFASAGIYFNLAHSEDLALFAITRVGPVGVDAECIREIENVEELVTRFFSPRENELFQKLSAEEKPTAFFNLWTRKEALLKATGEGLTGGLNRVEVSFLKGEPARLLAISGDTKKATEWTLQELSPANGFIGALAIQARDVRILTNALPKI
jgi:4'-phosphopantetheinyl transferase